MCFGKADRKLIGLDAPDSYLNRVSGWYNYWGVRHGGKNFRKRIKTANVTLRKRRDELCMPIKIRYGRRWITQRNIYNIVFIGDELAFRIPDFYPVIANEQISRDWKRAKISEGACDSGRYAAVWRQRHPITIAYGKLRGRGERQISYNGSNNTKQNLAAALHTTTLFRLA